MIFTSDILFANHQVTILQISEKCVAVNLHEVGTNCREVLRVKFRHIVCCLAGNSNFSSSPSFVVGLGNGAIEVLILETVNNTCDGIEAMSSTTSLRNMFKFSRYYCYQMSDGISKISFSGNLVVASNSSCKIVGFYLDYSAKEATMSSVFLLESPPETHEITCLLPVLIVPYNQDNLFLRLVEFDSLSNHRNNEGIYILFVSCTSGHVLWTAVPCHPSNEQGRVFCINSVKPHPLSILASFGTSVQRLCTVILPSLVMTENEIEPSETDLRQHLCCFVEGDNVVLLGMRYSWCGAARVKLSCSLPPSSSHVQAWYGVLLYVLRGSLYGSRIGGKNGHPAVASPPTRLSAEGAIPIVSFGVSSTALAVLLIDGGIMHWLLDAGTHDGVREWDTLQYLRHLVAGSASNTLGARAVPPKVPTASLQSTTAIVSELKRISADCHSTRNSFIAADTETLRLASLVSFLQRQSAYPLDVSATLQRNVMPSSVSAEDTGFDILLKICIRDRSFALSLDERTLLVEWECQALSSPVRSSRTVSSRTFVLRLRRDPGTPAGVDYSVGAVRVPVDICAVAPHALRLHLLVSFHLPNGSLPRSQPSTLTRPSPAAVDERRHVPCGALVSLYAKTFSVVEVLAAGATEQPTFDLLYRKMKLPLGSGGTKEYNIALRGPVMADQVAGTCTQTPLSSLETIVALKTSPTVGNNHLRPLFAPAISTDLSDAISLHVRSAEAIALPETTYSGTCSMQSVGVCSNTPRLLALLHEHLCREVKQVVMQSAASSTGKEKQLVKSGAASWDETLGAPWDVNSMPQSLKQVGRCILYVSGVE